MRVVGNTFGTAGGGYGYAGSGISRNNIYNDWGTQSCPYGASDGDYNLVYPAPAGSGCTHGTHDQWGKDPKFVNLAGHDYHLQSSSPAINVGTFITTTTSAGNGAQVPVADAKMFVDGFGIADGDSIQLQGQTQVAKITSINYSTNMLTVDRSLTWTSGLGVSLPYSGSAPDIGAYEYATTGIGQSNSGSNHHFAVPFMYPNPMRTGLVDRCFAEIKGFMVYDLAGQVVPKNAIRVNGIYLVGVKNELFKAVIIE
jgi:hypothetical protein